MAHAEKFTKGAIYGLYKHVDRKSKNHSNELIDISKSHLNYDLCNKEGDTLTRMNNRLEEVYMLNRKDVNVAISWALTLPQELKDKTAQQQRDFFEASYNFLSERYGKENVLSANVHLDETTPHMHFLFMPVVYDKKNERNKVSANDVLTRTELRSFHKDLDNHLKENIPSIYKRGVLNDKTIDVKNVKELKEMQKQIDIEKAKNKKLKTKYSKYNKRILESKKILEKISLQKSKLSDTYKLDEKDFTQIKKISFTGVNAMESYALLERDKNKEIKKLESKLKQAEQNSNELRNLRLENKKINKELSRETEVGTENIAVINELKDIHNELVQKFNGYFEFNNLPISPKSLDAYKLMNDLKKGYEPKNLRETNNDIRLLNEVKEENIIPINLLDKFINILKNIKQKFLDIKKQRDLRKVR